MLFCRDNGNNDGQNGNNSPATLLFCLFFSPSSTTTDASDEDDDEDDRHVVAKYKGGQRKHPSVLKASSVRRKKGRGLSRRPSNESLMSDPDRREAAKSKTKRRASKRDDTEKTPPSVARKPAAVASVPDKDAEEKAKNLEVQAKNAELKGLVRDACRKELWRLVKFIQGANALKKVAGKCLEIMGITGYKFKSKEPQDIAQIEQWVEENSKVVAIQMNEQRCYAVSQMKKASLRYLAANKATSLPSLGAIELIVTRSDAADPDIFQWWWDEVLPMAAANSVHWTPEQRHYETISTSQAGNSAKCLNIPPSTEAFAAVCYECNRKKWMQMAAISAAHPGQKILYAQNEAQVKRKNPNAYYAYTDEYPNLQPLYTDAKVGQAKFGGWKRAGLARYAELLKLNQAARLTAESKVLETAVLLALRAHHGIQGKTLEEELARTGATKAKKPDAVEEEIDGLLWGADEEFAT